MTGDKKDLLIKVSFCGVETTCHVIICGSGRPLVCLHGIGSSGWNTFSGIVPHLSSQFTLVIIDWLGFGKSSVHLRKVDTYSASYLTEWLAAVLKEFEENRIALHPFSFLAGSMGSLGVMLLHLRGLQPVGPSIFVNPAGFSKRINFWFASSLANPLFPVISLARLAANSQFVWQRILGWDAEKQEWLKDGLADGRFEVLLRYVRAGILPWGGMKKTHIIRDRVRELNFPVVLVYGENDTHFPTNDYLTYGAELPHASVIKLSDVGHNVFTKKPEELSRIIKQFFNQIS